MRLRLVVIVSALASATALGFGCGGGDATSPLVGNDGGVASPEASAPVGPTYYKDVAPIMVNTCQNCHVAGGIAPFPLMTYDDAKAYAEDIVLQTSTKTMPPWGEATTTECAPRFGFRDDIRLTDAQIATLKGWVDAGMQAGDPKDAPPAKTPLPPGLQGSPQVVAPLAPYTLQGSADAFRCFVLDPQLTQTSYLNAMAVIPGNPKIVHHVLVFSDPKGASKAKADPATGQYDCFGGPGIPTSGGLGSSGALLTAWAPGAGPQIYPSNAAFTLTPGTLLVMQVHYHPTGAGTEAPDATKFQMGFASSQPQYSVYTALLGNFNSAVKNGIGLLPGPDDPDPNTPVFLIPANKSGHTETMLFTMPTTISGFPTPTAYVYGSGAHMHWVGTDEKMTIHRASPTATQPADECLLQEPKWNFYWQRGYQYDVPIEQLPTVGPGDQVTVRCTYDNTLQNPRLALALMQQGLTSPRDVRLGESTLDEMCLGVFALLVQLP
jgi:hypothetical protein